MNDSTKKRESLHEEVLRRLKRDIITGRYRKGDFLPTEAEISAAMGVSRSVVREATRVLRAQGYIDAKRGRNGGLVVINETPTALLEQLLEHLLMGEVSLRHAFELRLLLELDACRRAARTHDPEGVRRLHLLNERLLSASSNSERAQINTEFHAAIGELGGNKMTVIILKLLLEFTNQAARMATGDDFFMRSEHRDEDHLPIVDAIERGRPDPASALLEAHMRAACGRLEEAERRFLHRLYRETMLSEQPGPRAGLPAVA